jgi:putative ABC transport system permease protein
MRLDLRLAWRALRRQPVLAIAVALTVGLAVAANTALFSVFDGLMFRPLPFPDAERIVHVDLPIEVRRTLPADDLRSLVTLMTESSLLEQRVIAAPFVGFEEGAADVEAWGLRPVSVTSDWFTLLGVSPVRGRDLFDGDDNNRVMLSESLWRARYNADPDLIGKAIDLPGMLFGRRPVLWGVLPADFSQPDGANVWFPSRAPLTSFNYARLAAGVTLEQVRATLPRVVVTPLREHLRPDDALALAVLLGATGLLLLVAWVQVAALLFARAAGRAAEIGVRLALGASRARVVRQFAAEGLLIAAAGLTIAMVVSPLLTRGVIALLPDAMTAGQSLEVDARAMVFAALVSLVGVLFLALIPIDIVRRSHPLGLLRGTVFGTVRTGAARTRGVMLMAQLAVTVVLIYMSGLAVQSASRIARVDLGFTPDNLVGLRMPPVTTRGSGTTSIRAHIELQRQRTVDLLDGLRALPGIATVAHGGLPFYSGRTLSSNRFPVAVTGQDNTVLAAINSISATYPGALGLTIIEGRMPAGTEVAASPAMALVNETLARQLATFGPVIGQRLTVNRSESVVVGVVGDFVTSRPDLPVWPEVMPIARDLRAQPPFVLVRLEAGEAGDRAVAGIRDTFDRIWTDNPSRELFFVPELAARAVADYRARATMLALIGVLCLPLAVVGISGALSYAIAQGRRDIAIRLALGAEAGDIRRAVTRRALAASLSGLALGLLAALGTGRLMSSYLFGVRAADPATLAVVAALLLSIAWLAAWLPARRASLIQPADALRDGV